LNDEIKKKHLTKKRIKFKKKKKKKGPPPSLFMEVGKPKVF
jgi:hypothetical protein